MSDAKVKRQPKKSKRKPIDGRRKPTRGELAIRPSVMSDDLLADRAIITANFETQQEPQGDNRKRVNFSAKFYVVQLLGEWVNVSETAERVVKSRKGLRWVTLESKDYELKRASEFKGYMSRFLSYGCSLVIGGKTVSTEKELRSITEHRFIYIPSSQAWKVLDEMRQSKRAQKNRK